MQKIPVKNDLPQAAYQTLFSQFLHAVPTNVVKPDVLFVIGLSNGGPPTIAWVEDEPGRIDLAKVNDLHAALDKALQVVLKVKYNLENPAAPNAD
jgi:hypothetical protein